MIHRKLGFKCTNDAYIHDQEVKIYKRHFAWNNCKFCKKSEFWRTYWIFEPPFWPEVDDVESWNSIVRNLENLYIGYFYYKFHENRIKTLTVTVPPWPHTKWLPWRHQLCKWAKTQTHTTRPMGDYFVKVSLKSAQ